MYSWIARALLLGSLVTAGCVEREVVVVMVDPARPARPTMTPGRHTGDAVSVEWNGKCYPAHILKAKQGSFVITYDGYGPEWNEAIGEARFCK